MRADYMRKIINGVLLLCICLLTAFVLINTTEPGTLLKVLKTAKMQFVYMGIAALGVYILLEVWMLRLMLNHGSLQRVSWLSVFRAAAVGQYFNLVTPFSSGGQPMQLHAMVEEGIPLKRGTAVLVNKFLFFQIGVTLYSFVLIAFNLLFLHSALPLTSRLVYFGVAVNCCSLFMILMFIYRPAVLKGISSATLHGLNKLRIIRRCLYWVNWMNAKIDDYTEHIRDMMAMKQLAVPVAALTLVQLTAYFSIGWFVYKALGLSGSSYLSIITLQALLFVSVAFIPTPGSAGASEYGFYLLFSAIFTQNSIAGGVLLWRGISYYLNMCVTGLITLGFSLKEMMGKHP